jgi:hypothetical protein
MHYIKVHKLKSINTTAIAPCAASNSVDRFEFMGSDVVVKVHFGVWEICDRKTTGKGAHMSALPLLPRTTFASLFSLQRAPPLTDEFPKMTITLGKPRFSAHDRFAGLGTGYKILSPISDVHGLA